MKNFSIDKLFIKYFSPKIELDITIDSFTFRKNGKKKTFNTYIYVSKEKKPRVISVGEEPFKSSEATKVDLFSVGNVETQNDKYDCLMSFLMHCISEMSSKHPMIRPTIVVGGINELNPVLNGYQRKFMMNLLTTAGAIDVTFKD
ncbi:hypothetical protein OOT00_15745 [Desulfobotulus sp. H1]|uniref:Uncharacterized protein n=1 Tax=Desulfobotulus pelophilus TaxID=2823377 RepID=A0ABT3NDD4_9BACT|nr:hypothetical protein [Desulfobotulus pelophilus]MCW7755430.1 hypothetical protein [Desulfobotulus pelophilus]